MTPEAWEEVRSFVAHRIREGFDSESEIVELAVQMVGDEHSVTGADAEILAAVAEALAAHRREQAAWPAVTDCDRLDQAFEILEGEGIVARQHFTCCGTCGVYEIGDEIEAATERGPVRGYTLFHQQDTESAAEGYGLFLNYGAVVDDADQAVRVGRRVASVLMEAGLEVDWDGSLARRIHVQLDWKKRR